MAVLGGDDSPSRFEAILAIIGSGSFPKRGERDDLTKTSVAEPHELLPGCGGFRERTRSMLNAIVNGPRRRCCGAALATSRP